MDIFVPPDDMSIGQLLWTFCTYAYMISMASNLISDGSELLLLIPQAAGLVGSIVLPILGAVPDGMMVLFSGLGPLLVAQSNVSVGVGALAGSTVMLLTVPWFLSVLGGRVDIVDGKAQYKKAEKLTNSGLFNTGIQFQEQIKANAKVMLVTSLTYLLIQVPAFMADDQKMTASPGKDGKPDLKSWEHELKSESKSENMFALYGLILCIVEFMAYLYIQYVATLPEDGKKPTTSPGCFSKVKTWFHKNLKIGESRYTTPAKIAEMCERMGIQGFLEGFRKEHSLGIDYGSNRQLLAEKSEDMLGATFKGILDFFFNKYANMNDSDGKISRQEFDRILDDLHLYYPSADRDKYFYEVDVDRSDSVTRDEFAQCFMLLAALPPRYTVAKRAGEASQKLGAGGEDDDEEEEQEEVPEDFKDLSPEDQRAAILKRSMWMMSVGTIMVLIFSDPLVEVLAAFGKVTGVPAFYISFVLAPLASNASELVAAYKYSIKKTSKTITVSLNTLEGAACMNNTFCLGIFLALIYVQGLAWKFTAETVSILLVQLIIFFIVVSKNYQTMFDACVILSLLPLSLALVYVMEANGFD
eukprot:TRINITY_DN276_c0_g1_i1.p1 TRINITY_DN276_c0_g1~~TRINITY_DN276_c0_g1_i1.p1  ORF type:complete len:584 (+),score=194.12 TRINITY_DN276_c0_g1_i1:106-1857(+)